jgi:hypothetical protein
MADEEDAAFTAAARGACEIFDQAPAFSAAFAAPPSKLGSESTSDGSVKLSAKEDNVCGLDAPPDKPESFS